MAFTRIKLITIFIGFSSVLHAQEWNIGAHIDPILTMPFAEDLTRSPYLQISPAKLTVGAGLNLNYKKDKWSVETGINAILKTISVTFDVDERYSNLPYTERAYKYRTHSNSLEVPLQVGYLVHRHKDKTEYDVYTFAGAGYEMNITQGTTSTTSLFSSPATAYANGGVNFSGGLPESGTRSQWVNLIVGFKINAILRGVGLIDYGMSFHYPIQPAATYAVNAHVNYAQQDNISTSFKPHIAHVEFRFCHYFLNFDKQGRKRYKNP